MLSWTGTWHHFVTGLAAGGGGDHRPVHPGLRGARASWARCCSGPWGSCRRCSCSAASRSGPGGSPGCCAPWPRPGRRLVAALCYLGLPLAYDALAQGRLDGLVAYAAVPWILSRLARASGLPPYAAPEEAVGWRSTLPGQMLTLGVRRGGGGRLRPGGGGGGPGLCARGHGWARSLVGEWRGSGAGAGRGRRGHRGGRRALRALGGGHAARRPLRRVGLRPGRVGGHVARRGATCSASPWARPAPAPSAGCWSPRPSCRCSSAARPAWPGPARLWAVAVLLLAPGPGRGPRAGPGRFAPSIDVLLAPAATAVAAGVGLGVASFEVDLAGYRFGWRQVATGLALVAAVVGLFPVVADAGDGRWGLADTGFAQAARLAARSGRGGGLPGAVAGRPPGPARRGLVGLGRAGLRHLRGHHARRRRRCGPRPRRGRPPTWPTPCAWPSGGLTAHLGRLLAPAAVRYVVVIEALAPQIPGVQTSPSMPPPPGLVTSLHQQSDLAQVSTSVGGLVVFENTTGLPQRAERTRPLPATAGRPAGWPTAQDVTGWRPVLPGPAGLRSYSGTVASGTVFASYAPAGRWRVHVHGLTVASTPAFGWAGQYENVPAGPATLRLGLTPLVPLAVIAELLLWLAVAGTLLGRRRWLDWWVAAGRRPPGPQGGRRGGRSRGRPRRSAGRRGRPRRRRRAIAVGGGPMTAEGRRPGNGRHAAAVRRLPVLVAVVASLVVAGLVDVAVSSTPAVPVAAPAASGAPVGAESSAWYCAGGSGTAGGPAGATLFLVNSADRPVGATLTVSASSGASAAETLTVPAFGQTTAVPSALVQGPWLAARVDVDGGGVTVSQLVHGAQGWSAGALRQHHRAHLVLRLGVDRQRQPALRLGLQPRRHHGRGRPHLRHRGRGGGPPAVPGAGPRPRCGGHGRGGLLRPEPGVGRRRGPGPCRPGGGRRAVRAPGLGGGPLPPAGVAVPRTRCGTCLARWT